ncbi:hypothetical protein Tco_0424100 [Tanacetum coccineum]
MELMLEKELMYRWRLERLRASVISGSIESFGNLSENRESIYGLQPLEVALGRDNLDDEMSSTAKSQQLSSTAAFTDELEYCSETSGEIPEVEVLVLTLATTGLLRELRTLDLLLDDFRHISVIIECYRVDAISENP